MSNLRILVVDDRQDWRQQVKQFLQRLGGHVVVDLASTYDEALAQVKNELYDLMVVDLALSSNLADSQDQQGLDLLNVVRESPANKHCGLIVLTGRGTITRVKRALHEYHVHDFIEKDKFIHADFVEAARTAIRDARLKKAETRIRERLYLTITFNQEQMTGSELIGPEQHSIYVAERRRRFNVTDLTTRADNLNLLVLKGGDLWRPVARSIGSEIYDALSKEPCVQNALIAAQVLSQHPNDLWLQFSGPPIGMGIPFELLHNGDYYLSYNHILTRRLVQTSPRPSRKIRSFHTFLAELLKYQEVLRVLIVGANVGSKIPAAETEAVSLKTTIESDLKQLGIACDVNILLGADASYAKVREVLHNGRYHIFHYAGHGYYQDKLPEASGLVLHDDKGLHILTAAELNTLVRDTELQLVFLSCCLGARNATKVGHGDFYGMLEALANAGVPIVLGYRWTVTDESALRLAQVFYEKLWHTFSPGEALLEARVNATLGPDGRDDETWASPVLFMQNV